MILLALVLRRLRRLEFEDDLVAYLGGLLAVFITVEGFFVFSETLTAAYPGAAFESEPIRRMLAGPYAPLFLFEVVVGLLVPFLVLARRRLRASPAIVATMSILAIIGILVHRLNIVLNGLSYPLVEFPPGLSIGEYTPGQPSFITSYWYAPSLVEWLIVLGVLAFGALVFTLAALVLPLRESGAH